MEPSIEPSIPDPDELALKTVMQYLSENTYDDALQALERASGRCYVADDRGRQGSQLLQWCYRHVEEAVSLAGDDDDAVTERRRAEARLLLPAPPDFPAALAASVEGLHTPANICTVACWPGAESLVTGSADGAVRIFSPSGELQASASAGASGVLCLSLLERRGDLGAAGLVAAGCMDGSVCVLDGQTLESLAVVRPHRKYVVAVRWAAGGRRIIAASWDESFSVLGAHGGGGGGALALEILHTEKCAGQVEDMCVLPGGGVLAAVRRSNYILEYSLGEESRSSSAAGGRGGAQLLARHNLNPTGDDHVSFTPCRLALSPCAALLLVSADNGRLLIYDLATWAQVRIFFLPVEPFHHHAIAWHRSGALVLAAAARGAIAVFEVGTCREAARFLAHSRGVRDLFYDGKSDRLVTCSFDRTVKVWRPRGEAEGTGGHGLPSGLC